MTSMAGARGKRDGERGLTLIEVLAALAIGSLVLSTIYLALGTAIRSRLLVASTLQSQQHGRLVVQWLGDRLRQAGYAVNYNSPIPRCRDALVVEDASLNPTAAALYFNTDLAGDGTVETIGFRLGTETVGGATVSVIQQSVTNCTSGAAEQVASIRSIRMIRIALVERVSAGAQGARDQTWTMTVSLRNPDPRTL